MTSPKPIIKLHTIQQWMSVDPSVRSVIMQNIKLKDRLYRFLRAKSEQELLEPVKVKCRDCGGHGEVLIEPRYDGLHPSQLPHPCLLMIYNQMVGELPEQKKTEARMQLVFDLGSAVHRMFQNYGLAGAWGPHYRKEVPITAEYQELAAALMLEGSADADNILIIDDIPNSPYTYEVGVVHEYKTMKSENFQKLTRPKPDHQVQAMVYSAALDRPIVCYIYMNKNDQNLADFPVEFNYDLWNKVGGKASLLKTYVDRRELPPAEVGYHCKECGYAYQCGPYQASQQLKGKF